MSSFEGASNRSLFPLYHHDVESRGSNHLVDIRRIFASLVPHFFETCGTLRKDTKDRQGCEL